MPEDWLSEIAAEMTLECLPESYQEVARIVGVANTLRLADYLGGQAFYFRKLGGVYRRKRDEGIRKEFTGCNHKELARKYCLSEVQIRSILRGPAPEQLALFDEGES
jgi:Mor family transcriptional regulator